MMYLHRSRDLAQFHIMFYHYDFMFCLQALSWTEYFNLLFINAYRFYLCRVHFSDVVSSYSSLLFTSRFLTCTVLLLLSPRDPSCPVLSCSLHADLIFLSHDVSIICCLLRPLPLFPSILPSSVLCNRPSCRSMSSSIVCSRPSCRNMWPLVLSLMIVYCWAEFFLPV